MNYQELTAEDLKLIELAKQTAVDFADQTWESDQLSSVGSAVKTKSGQIYTGANIRCPHSAPASICAEYTALAQAYAKKDREVETMVSYHFRPESQQVASPCGQCREFIRLFGNPWIIVQTKEGLKKILLSDLNPYAENW